MNTKDIVMGGNTTGFFNAPLPRFKYHKIRQECIKAFSSKSYVELQEKINLYLPMGLNINDFFIHEGNGLLHYALATSSQSQALQFIIDNVSSETIEDVLTENKFILTSFLQAEAGSEIYNHLKQNSIEVRNEKLRLLLKIAPEVVIESLQNNINEPWLPTGVKESLNSILKSNQQQFL